MLMAFSQFHCHLQISRWDARCLIFHLSAPARWLHKALWRNEIWVMMRLQFLFLPPPSAVGAITKKASEHSTNAFCNLLSWRRHYHATMNVIMCREWANVRLLISVWVCLIHWSKRDTDSGSVLPFRQCSFHARSFTFLPSFRSKHTRKTKSDTKKKRVYGTIKTSFAAFYFCFRLSALIL